MKKLKKYIIPIVIIAVISLLGIYGYSYAKYVSNSIWNYYLKSKGFYFSSDYLATTVVKNVNNLWDGGSVYFNIRNNLNQTVITNYDINYTATCTITGDAASLAQCHMNGTTSNTEDGVLTSFQICSNTTGDEVDVSEMTKTDCELGGYEWTSQIATKDLYFDVVLNDAQTDLKDVTVNVTVTSTSPYHQTISGDFNLHKSNLEEDNVTMDYKNYTNYDKLIISNSYSANKCVRVTWNSDSLVINANPSEFSSYVTDTNGYIKEIILNVNAKNSISYIFYKKDFNMTYDVNEFSIEETSGC